METYEYWVINLKFQLQKHQLQIKYVCNTPTEIQTNKVRLTIKKKDYYYLSNVI